MFLKQVCISINTQPNKLLSLCLKEARLCSLTDKLEIHQAGVEIIRICMLDTTWRASSCTTSQLPVCFAFLI